MEDPRQYFEFIREKLRSPHKAEALAWLEGDECRTIWEYSNQESIALVQRLYSMGAVEVTAGEISGDICCELLIRLPDDRRLRDNVFAWSGEQAESRGFERDKDFGQEYLFSFFT